MSARPHRHAWLGHYGVRITLLLAVLASALALSSKPASAGAYGSVSIVVVELHGAIDPATVPLVRRALGAADASRARAVILDIDTLGGRLDTAVAIRDALLATPVRTVAFVHPRAISAGALLALASDTVAMHDTGTIGAATPVTTKGASVNDKTLSFVDVGELLDALQFRDANI